MLGGKNMDGTVGNERGYWVGRERKKVEKSATILLQAMGRWIKPAPYSPLTHIPRDITIPTAMFSLIFQSSVLATQ